MYEVVEEINVQISMNEQRGQIEQAKHRLCTLLHLMGHKRHRHRDLAKGCVNTKIREGSSVTSMTHLSSQSETELTESQYVFELTRSTLGTSQR